MRIGLFFGSFDPIHIGHIGVANTVINSGLVDAVYFVVAFANPWKNTATPYKWRVDMTRMALRGCENLYVSTVEGTMFKESGKTSFFTFDVLNKINEENVVKGEKVHDFFIITTQETYSEIPKWVHGEEVMKNNKFIILKSPRFENITFTPKEGDIVIECPNFPVNSTLVRNMTHENKELIPYVLPNVAKFIKKNNLYVNG